jgi:hypothetical protein
MTQANVKIVDNDGSDAGIIIGNSDGGGTQKLTIAANVAVGTDQACRSCLLMTAGTDVYVTLADEAADVNDFLLLSEAYLPMPIKNLNQLRFYGVTDGIIIHVLWRS